MLRDHIDECTHFRFTKKLLASFTLLLALVLSTSAQATTVTNSGNATNICDEDPETCCISFTITFSEATDHVRIQLVNAGTSDACIDIACWLGQDNYPFVQHTRTANGVYDIHFSPAKTASQTYTFTMCAPASCWANWSAIRWEALLDDNTNFSHGPMYSGGSAFLDLGPSLIYAPGKDVSRTDLLGEWDLNANVGPLSVGVSDPFKTRFQDMIYEIGIGAGVGVSGISVGGQYSYPLTFDVPKPKR